MQYTSLVESVARRFAGATETIDDLIQEGFIGLITAVDGFNAKKGVKFSTYATHFVIGQIKHHLRDRGKIIKEPAWLQELNQRVTRIIEALTQELGRPPTNREIASMTGMNEETVAELLTTREVFKVASLDGGSESEDESLMGTYDIDRVKADRQIELEVPVEDRLILQNALQKLKDLEQSVIQEFYFRERNQTEIARNMGISCNYVSHILRNSTKKLKKILVSDELKEMQMEMALMRRRMEEQARLIDEQTVVDGLTHLYNRHYFDNRLEEEVSRASRNGHPVAVLLVALYGSAQISRAYGTLRAEDVLRHAASIIRESVRRVDIVTRYDEEVFGLILPHTGEHARLVAGRLAANLREWIVGEELHAGRAPLALGVSMAAYPRDASSARDLILSAEGSLRPLPMTDASSLAA
jgi:RNA polymerase sigma-B factor